MKLRRGKTYTAEGSDLAIIVLGNVFKSSTCFKFKGKLINKRNGIVYERKNYKIPFDVPTKSKWKEISRLDVPILKE